MFQGPLRQTCLYVLLLPTWETRTQVHLTPWPRLFEFLACAGNATANDKDAAENVVTIIEVMVFLNMA